MAGRRREPGGGPSPCARLSGERASSARNIADSLRGRVPGRAAAPETSAPPTAKVGKKKGSVRGNTLI